MFGLKIVCAFKKFMDNSLICQTSVIDPIDTLQHALETNNVSCKLLSFCSVVETKVEGVLAIPPNFVSL